MKFRFSALDWKYPFWANLVQKIKIVSLSWNLVPKLIRIWRILMVVFTFSVFRQKYPFWPNLVQKIKIASLSWNLALRLIPVCRIWWWRSFFLFSTGSILFSKFKTKKSKLFEIFFSSFRLEIPFLGQFTWLIYQQFTCRNLRPVAFLVSIKRWKISKPAVIVSGTCPSFRFPWLPALVCFSKVFVQTVLCY